MNVPILGTGKESGLNPGYSHLTKGIPTTKVGGFCFPKCPLSLRKNKGVHNKYKYAHKYTINIQLQKATTCHLVGSKGEQKKKLWTRVEKYYFNPQVDPPPSPKSTCFTHI